MLETSLPKTLFAFIRYFLRPYPFASFMKIFLALMAGLWGPLNSLLVKQVLALLPSALQQGTSVLWVPIVCIAFNFLILDNLTWRGLAYIHGAYVPRALNQLLSVMTQRTLKRSAGFFHSTLSGALAKHITQLADSAENLITDVSSNLLRGAALLLGAFVVAYTVHPLFCLILLVWLALFGLTTFFLSKPYVRRSEAYADSEALVSGEIVDTLSCQQAVRFWQGYVYEKKRFQPFLEKRFLACQRMRFFGIFVHGVQGVLIALMMLVSGLLLLNLYGKGVVAAADFALIFLVTMETGHMTWFTAMQWDTLNRDVGRCRKSLSILLNPAFDTAVLSAKTLSVTKGDIVFQKVCFAYVPDVSIFHNQSAHILAGQKVGLVGYSGGGKSTFLNLLLRLYNVQSGEILIDGQNIAHVTETSLRRQIAMIPQDPTLFHRSLFENIRYGLPDASAEAVQQAAQKAHAHDFIKTLTAGYDTLVGERGLKLSGGQRQRIALARAFLRPSPIVLLDEATSQLDSLTESLIQKSLYQLLKDKTALVVAHRLSTLLQMDRILVFDKGRIVEDGAHQVLLEKNGLYAKMWHAQAGGFLGDIGPQ